MDSAIPTPSGHFAVVDGPARAQWERHSTGGWRFGGLWPSASQRRAIADHMKTGGALLVIIDAAPASVLVMRDECEWSVSDDESEFVELSIPSLDWLPTGMRRAGERFRRRTLAGLVDVPILQRPGVVVGGWVAGTRLKFALRVPGVRADLTPASLTSLADAVLRFEGTRWWPIRPARVYEKSLDVVLR